MNKLSLGGRYIYTFLIGAAVSVAPMLSFAQIEEVVVTANKREQNIQDVSTSITALNEEAIDRAGIIDIIGLETVVPGLRIGTSGSEARPALRGARTNDVGVAGPGIAEQVIGIFQDGIYTPTTTAGLGAYIDINRIEVLRGPQGTLYGRNTFAGSINIISNGPDFEEIGGSVKALQGDYNRTNYEAVLNLPITDSFATRLAASSDQHDGLIENLYGPGNSDDLRERNRSYLRSTSQWNISDDLSATLRFDYSEKDSNSEAIWGYQQIAGYALTETDASMPTDRMYEPNATVTQGHIYQSNFPLSPEQQTRLDALRVGDPDTPESAVTNNDEGPYDVYRNGPSIDDQRTSSTTLAFDWSGLNFADAKLTFNYSQLKGRQYYDSDYSDRGNELNGFGRRDDQETYSVELQFVSNNDGPLGWVGGLYYFDQEADWYWLFDVDNGARIGACCGTLNNDDPHTVESIAVYGQSTYELTEQIRVIGGLRYNNDEKEFTGDISDWDDNTVLWKTALEYDVTNDSLAYASVATGYRTGGANDTRTRAAGAPETYDNEDVISYELGFKNSFFNNTMTLNISAFANTYEDVKAQLFAVACTNGARTVANCADDSDPSLPGDASTLRTFEYSENGGDVDSYGLEIEMLWSPVNELLLNASVAYLDSEFDDDFEVGNSQLRPLLGLGNYQGRQDVNDPNSRFSFGGWAPALAPEYTISLGGSYDIHLSGKWGDSVLTPSLQFKYVDDYYAFDVNIPETLQDSHVIGDARLTWSLKDDAVRLEAFVMNLFDEEVLTRAVVHSQLRDGIPINSVQANWNNPRAWGISFKYSF